MALDSINNISPYWGRDEGSKVWIHDEACRVMDFAYLGHEDGNLSLDLTTKDLWKALWGRSDFKYCKIIIIFLLQTGDFGAGASWPRVGPAFGCRGSERGGGCGGTSSSKVRGHLLIITYRAQFVLYVIMWNLQANVIFKGIEIWKLYLTLVHVLHKIYIFYSENSREIKSSH